MCWSHTCVCVLISCTVSSEYPAPLPGAWEEPCPELQAFRELPSAPCDGHLEKWLRPGGPWTPNGNGNLQLPFSVFRVKLDGLAGPVSTQACQWFCGQDLLLSSSALLSQESTFIFLLTRLDHHVPQTHWTGKWDSAPRLILVIDRSPSSQGCCYEAFLNQSLEKFWRPAFE